MIMPLDSSSEGDCHVIFRENGLKLKMVGAGIATGVVAPVRPDTHGLAAFPALFSARTYKNSR